MFIDSVVKSKYYCHMKTLFYNINYIINVFLVSVLTRSELIVAELV